MASAADRMDDDHHCQKGRQNEEHLRGHITDLAASYSYEELRALGVRIVRDEHREKVALHKQRVDARMAKLNSDARRAQIEHENHMVLGRSEEWKRLLENARQRMAGSAFHIDLAQSDEERRQRLANNRRNKYMQKQRNDVLNNSKTSVQQLRSPKSPVVFKDEKVNTGQIYTMMALNQKIVDDQLKATKQNRKEIADIIDQELDDTRRMFPLLAVKSPGRPTGLEKLSSPTTPTQLRPTTTIAAEQLPSRPESPSSINSRSPSDVLRLETVLDPFEIDMNAENLNLSGSQRSSRSFSPQQGTPLRRPATGQTPATRRSPSQAYLQTVGKLSTRFDSSSCLLPIKRPELPSTLNVSVLLPNYK